MELARILDSMEPAEALAALQPQLRKILSSLDQEAVVAFVTGLMARENGDKLSSMVHL